MFYTWEFSERNKTVFQFAEFLSIRWWILKSIIGSIIEFLSSVPNPNPVLYEGRGWHGSGLCLPQNPGNQNAGLFLRTTLTPSLIRNQSRWISGHRIGSTFARSSTVFVQYPSDILFFWLVICLLRLKLLVHREHQLMSAEWVAVTRFLSGLIIDQLH